MELVGSEDTLVLAGGILLLLFGRHLFWLMLSGAGFAAGLYGVHQAWPAAGLVPALFAGVLLALACAALGMLVQAGTVAVSGFLAGGLLAEVLARPWLEGLGPAWLVFLVGGVLGAFALLYIFDWALAFGSAVFGGFLVATGLGIESPFFLPVQLLLAAAGFLWQARGLRPAGDPD